jgi:tripartite-type tricarboxylate transporter receptor subunit TctC
LRKEIVMDKGLPNVVRFIIGIFLVVGTSTTAVGEEFYKGKMIRIIVSGSPGGGFDTYSRLIGRHMGKHIPGNPSFIVQSMTGAGTRIAAKYLHSAAKPDGLTFGIINGYLILGKVLGMKGLDYDVKEFEWIGTPIKDHVVCALHKLGGITSLKQWFASKKPVKIGALGPGNSTSDVPRLLKATLGLPIHVVEGYKGTSVIRIAAESGEVDGACWAWQSMKPTWSRALQSGDVKVFIQASTSSHPDLPNVPVAIDLAKTEGARQLIRAGVVKPSSITRLYLTTPGTPKKRVQILRKAFMDTLKDPELLAEAKKANLAINPQPGEEVKRTVAEMFQISPSQLAELKSVLAVR